MNLFARRKRFCLLTPCLSALIAYYLTQQRRFFMKTKLLNTVLLLVLAIHPLRSVAEQQICRTANVIGQYGDAVYRDTHFENYLGRLANGDRVELLSNQTYINELYPTTSPLVRIRVTQTTGSVSVGAEGYVGQHSLNVGSCLKSPRKPKKQACRYGLVEGENGDGMFSDTAMDDYKGRLRVRDQIELLSRKAYTNLRFPAASKLIRVRVLKSNGTVRIGTVGFISLEETNLQSCVK
jgi:hypothetical protein